MTMQETSQKELRDLKAQFQDVISSQEYLKDQYTKIEEIKKEMRSLRASLLELKKLLNR